jgi:hypothetical protein
MFDTLKNGTARLTLDVAFTRRAPDADAHQRQALRGRGQKYRISIYRIEIVRQVSRPIPY